MHIIDAIILLGWLAFWVYWLAASANVKARREGQRCSGARVGPMLLVLFILLRIGVLNGGTISGEPWLEGFGLAIWALGLGLALWARFYIGRNWGAPMSQNVDPELVTTGPYRTIRHPIYTGIILGNIGTTMAVNLYWLAAVILAGAYFIYSATQEERYLAEEFPDTYPAYKKSTRMLIPFIY